MSMRAYEDIKEMLCDEIDEIARKGEISAGDLEALYKLTDTIKNIDKIVMLEEDGGYSQAGDWEAMGRGRFGDDFARNSYDDGGNSYRGQRRDSMGRYSRARDGRRGYSRDGGKDDMMEHVDMMMEVASTPEEREAVKRFKKQLENL